MIRKNSLPELYLKVLVIFYESKKHFLVFKPFFLSTVFILLGVD